MRDIKRRIRAVVSTQQITKAMKMVAAAKLRRTQAQVVAARPYSGKLEEMIGRLVSAADFVHPLLEKRDGGRIIYVVFTADRGLCGSYNINILRKGAAAMRERPGEIVAIGRKARDFYSRRGGKVIESYVGVGDEADYGLASRIARDLVRRFEAGQADEVVLVYTKFNSPLSQTPTVKTLLPITIEEGEKTKEVDYVYQPSPEAVIELLLPKFVQTEVYHAFMEAKASEHGARMTAMESATDNAAELIDRLTLDFNRARQAAITAEISEIVGGAEALKG